MAKKLTDKELQQELKWSEDNIKELDDITSGRVTRGAFARIAGLKMKLEAAHHALIKDAPQIAAPVVIMLMGMEEPQVKQIGQESPIEAELVAPQALSPMPVLEEGEEMGEGCPNEGTDLQRVCPCGRCVTARTA